MTYLKRQAQIPVPTGAMEKLKEICAPFSAPIPKTLAAYLTYAQQAPEMLAMLPFGNITFSKTHTMVYVEKTAEAAISEKAKAFGMKKKAWIELLLEADFRNESFLLKEAASENEPVIDTERSYSQRRQFPVEQRFFRKMRQITEYLGLKAGPVIQNALNEFVSDRFTLSFMAKPDFIEDAVFHAVNIDTYTSERVRAAAKSLGLKQNELSNAAFNYLTGNDCAFFKNTISGYLAFTGETGVIMDGGRVCEVNSENVSALLLRMDLTPKFPRPPQRPTPPELLTEFDAPEVSSG